MISATLGSVTGAVPEPTAVAGAAFDPVLVLPASFLETATPAKVPAATAAEPAPTLATLFTLEVAGLVTRLADNFLGAALRDETFLATAFFATAFFATAFFAGDFLTETFLARAFLAGAFLAGAFLAGAFLATDERTVLEPAAMAPLLSITEGSTRAPKSAMPTERVSHILARCSELAFCWILSIWILTFHS